MKDLATEWKWNEINSSSCQQFAYLSFSESLSSTPSSSGVSISSQWFWTCVQLPHLLQLANLWTPTLTNSNVCSHIIVLCTNYQKWQILSTPKLSKLDSKHACGLGLSLHWGWFESEAEIIWIHTSPQCVYHVGYPQTISGSRRLSYTHDVTQGLAHGFKYSPLFRTDRQILALRFHYITHEFNSS